MFLQRLKIENIRSVKSVEIDFHGSGKNNRKWTMLLGENGTGKSTILRAAALVLSGSDALPALIPDPRQWIRSNSESARIEATLATAGGKTRRIVLELRAGDTVSSAVKRNDANLRQLDEALQHANRNYFVAGYGASRRLPGEEQARFNRSEAFSHPRAQAVASLFSRDAELRAMDSWAMDLHYRRRNEGFKLIQTTMGELLPGVTFQRIDQAQRQLLFQTPDGIVPLQQLSDGYQNIAAWCGDLLFRITETFPDYRKPLETRGLLLLDEIDLHLHPVWQRQLLQFLDAKLPNLQIIATTHSPFTAQQSPLEALHVLERAPKIGTIAVRQYKGDPRLLRVEQLLEPLLGLKTSESLETEVKRQKVRQLKGKKHLLAIEKQELSSLAESLTALPQAQAIAPAEKKRLDLLVRIERRFGSLPVKKEVIRRRRK